MTQEEIDELIALLRDPVFDWGDCDDSELGPEREQDCDRICELLDKIKPH